MQQEDRQWETAQDELIDALDLVRRSLDGDGVDYVLIGGIAVAALSRARWTHDIDVFVRPEDAVRVLDLLAEAGMTTEQTDMGWLFKAFHGSVLVDVIFRSHGDFYLDDEMVERAVERPFKGSTIRVIAPEDLVVMKALVHDEHNPRHWHDALSLIAHNELDCDYLMRRARHGRRRVLSLLLYAQSNDLPVARTAVETLWSQLSEC